MSLKLVKIEISPVANLCWIRSGSSFQETGKLAATINSKHRQSVLEVNYGIQISPSKTQYDFLKDIRDSISTANRANQIFPRTVTSKLQFKFKTGRIQIRFTKNYYQVSR